MMAAWAVRRICKDRIISQVKAQEEQYARNEREMLRQKRYEDANYYKGARDAMKNLGAEL